MTSITSQAQFPRFLSPSYELISLQPLQCVCSKCASAMADLRQYGRSRDRSRVGYSSIFKCYLSLPFRAQLAREVHSLSELLVCTVFWLLLIVSAVSRLAGK